MSSKRLRDVTDDYDELDDEWVDQDSIERIRRRDRSEESEGRREARRKRERRRVPPAHKRDDN